MEEMTLKVKKEQLKTLPDRAGAKDLFPKIFIDQETEETIVVYLNIYNPKRGQYGQTHEHQEEVTPDVIKITGETGLRNDRRYTGGGGRQKFCFFVFRGDSGHLYTHRAVASKGWLTCPPEKLLKRLRKLGIGAEHVIQQGDFLLKPAKGRRYPDIEFAHETRGAGHHNFEMPVLYATGEQGRQYKITEPTLLIHTAVDGIQHPSISVPPGIYVVGTTSTGLDHSNRRD